MSSEDRIERERRRRKDVLRGEEHVWRAWYDETAPGLFSYVLWRCARLHQIAEEIVQETWLIAVRRIRAFDPAQGSFSSWLRGIAANLMRNYFRRESRNGHVSLNGHDPVGDHHCEAHLRAWQLAEALIELPQRYEDVLRAKYLDGQSVKEIAEDWKESPKAIESLLTRARQAFREAYQPEEDHHE